MTTFDERYGPWALVAGGSEGIGAAYARELARRGVHLVLVAHDSPALEPLAAELERQYRVDVRAVDLDLARPDVVAALEPSIDGLDLGLLVYNAAFSPIGEFLDTPEEHLVTALDVNVRGPMLLARALGARLVARGRGGVILMASLAATQGSAMVAAYSATKAFNRVLAEGLWEEFGRHGVDVLAVAPGTTDTPGFRSSRPAGGPKPMPAAVVARRALDALGRGHPVVVPGWQNRLSGALMARVLPRRRAIRLMSSVTRRMYR